ncbi:MAG: DUF2125 domain-containing protein [Paracoccus sp. (in: a-proteobacteria)]|uniref:DUF2125 domain-containing protein n=1 Tax=Paracoccus sp. TaxID=267 RepID=UPI00391D98FA
MWRGTLIGVTVVAILGAGLWLGGETVAADRLRQHIAQSPALDAASVTPLRSPEGMGLRLEAPAVGDARAGLALPWARLLLSPTSPTTLQLDLPPEGRLTLDGRVHDLTAGAAQALLSVAPLRGMVVDALHIEARDLRIDGMALARQIDLDLAMQRLGHDAPRPARASYDADIAIDGMAQAGLSQLGLQAGELPGDLSAQGVVRLWLDGPLRPGQARPPQLVGGQTDGLTLASGDLSARIVARLAADEAGFAQGRVALYTRDAGAIVDHMAELGLIPDGARLLLRAGLSQLGRAGFAQGDAPQPGPDFPEATGDELRLPLLFQDGQMFLGTVPLGPAPRLLP